MRSRGRPLVSESFRGGRLSSVSAWAGALARKARPWGFPVIYIGWAYLFWIPLLFSDESVWSFPNILFFLAGGASPLLAGVLLTWLADGHDGLRDLGRRMIDARRIPIRWLAVIVLFWPLFDLVMAGAARALGLTDRPLSIAWDVVTDPATLGFMLLLSFVFPAVEEVGLRGQWLDDLQERFSPAVAALINGAGWAIWHTPFVSFPGYYADTSFSPQLWWWLPSIVVQTVLIVWVYNGTGRSILAVLLFHALMNFTGEFLGLAPEIFPYMLVGSVLAAAAVVAGSRVMRSGPLRHRRPMNGQEAVGSEPEHA